MALVAFLPGAFSGSAVTFVYARLAEPLLYNDLMNLYLGAMAGGVCNALFWLTEFHIDGLRVDAVASMLYLDYSRQDGQWVPNQYGGRENLEAIEFIKSFNVQVHAHHPGVLTIAEESTAWAGVSRPTYTGGLGFSLKWNMGWMHDMLDYTKEDPVHRKWHHNKITFSMMYAYSEKFILPFSHDEVVHGKRSMLDKMPGDVWQKHANLRALYGYMFVHPGKKLMFMGGEIAQEREWNHDRGLDWFVLDQHDHQGVHHLIRDLNGLYRALPALHQLVQSPWHCHAIDPYAMGRVRCRIQQWWVGTQLAKGLHNFRQLQALHRQVKHLLARFNDRAVPCAATQIASQLLTAVQNPES